MRLSGRSLLSLSDRQDPTAEEDLSDLRIRQVRERIASGYYDRPEIIERIVDRILASLQPSSIDREQHP